MVTIRQPRRPRKSRTFRHPHRPLSVPVSLSGLWLMLIPGSEKISHPHPVLGIAFHPSLFSVLLTYDAASTLRLIDWVKPNRPIVMSLVDPEGLSCAYAGSGHTLPRRGGVDWMPDDVNTCAPTILSRFSPAWTPFHTRVLADSASSLDPDG
jgi:hypothetical protein